MVKDRARLPCDVTSSTPEDRVLLILWYRGHSETPIYSWDSRGVSVSEGKHGWDETVLDQRATFHLLLPGTSRNGPLLSGSTINGPLDPGAYLELFPVQDRDQGRYRCRVDYLLSATKNTIINFTVIIPPHKVEIYNSTGGLVVGQSGAAIIGPYNEGDQLNLVCKVSGGRPTPTVLWLVNNEVFPTETVTEDSSSVTVSLTLLSLSVGHLHTILECRTNNFNMSTPLSASATLDMNFKPAGVHLAIESGSLSAGSQYELVCQSWGSRPPAIITWWKGGTTQLKNAVMTTSPDSNVTTSILQYQAEMGDSGKYLTCRAHNTHISHSAKEEAVRLNVLYRPVVTLQLGSSLDPDNIKEGDDVYFECHINANPAVTRVTWHHNGELMQPKPSRGVILQNQTLVLQGVSRGVAGLYTCAARNTQGHGDSQPIQLNVNYAPHCQHHSQTIYGTALHEPASVTCEVEARPGTVTFRWTFNNTSEHLPIHTSAVTSQNQTSVARYAPKSHLDYGTLLCWAFNTIGEQSVPCAFTIIPAGPPDPPRNCSLANQTTEGLEVQCQMGFDGGLPQRFYMEVYDSTTKYLHHNISSPSPVFLVTALPAGPAFLILTYAANAKGRSNTVRLETQAIKVAEKRTGPPTLLELTTFLAIILGVVLVVVFIIIAVILVFKFRKTHPADGPHNMVAGGSTGGSGDGGGVREQYKTTRENNESTVKAGSTQVEENSDPDVIPHKADLVPGSPSHEASEQGHSGLQQQQQQQQQPSTFNFQPPHSLLQCTPTVPWVGVNPLVSPLSTSPTRCQPQDPHRNNNNRCQPQDPHRNNNFYQQRRSLSVNPCDLGSTTENRTLPQGYTPGPSPHHNSNPSLYATLDYRQGVTSTLTPSMYASLPHRRAANAPSSSSTLNIRTIGNNNQSLAPGFTNLRKNLITTIIRRPSESIV